MPALGWGQDPYGAVAGWSGVTAAVSAASGGKATITGLGNMSPLSVGRSITFYGAASAANNGTFVITDYISSVSVKVANVNAVAPDANNNSIGWIERLQTTPSVYGSSVAGLGTSIVSALALSTHEVQVTLSEEPKHSTPYSTGDALNPATWTVQRLDTAEFLHVINVLPISPTSYGVVTLEAFGGVDVIHTISSNTLQDTSGQTLNAPRSADFEGLLEAAAGKAVERSRGVSRDLRNNQTPRQTPEGLDSGTLVVNGAGDYAEMSGAELVRKLVIRRLIARPGDFFHMPDYGVGLRVKEPIPAGDLSKLKARIEQQVVLEPEVDTVRASLYMAATGELTVQVRGKLRPTGEPLDVTLPVLPGSVSL